MPSFAEQRETLRRWERFPGREHSGGGVWLTFDDGPDPDATPAVLEVLGDTRATFFLVGEQVNAHQDLARELTERGHEPALHGFRHMEHDELADPRGDLERGLTAVEDACGVRPRRFRPPYGRFSEDSYAACRELGLEPVYWSAWGGDWEPVPPDRIADLATRDLNPDAILLLHDSARYAYRGSARATVEALPAILAAVGELG